MLRAAVTVALLGLAAALALPALHLTTATTGMLIGRWWPVILVGAGVAGLLRWRRRRFYGAWWPIAVGVLGLYLLAGHFLAWPVVPVFFAAVLLVVGIRFALGGWRGRSQTGWLPRWMGGGDVLRLAGDVHLGGPDWRVENSSMYLGVGELHLDLTRTRLREGTTPLRIGMFAGEVEITVPPDVGVRASSSMTAGEIHILGHHSEGVSPHLTVESDDFQDSARRLDIDVQVRFGELHVRRRG